MKLDVSSMFAPLFRLLMQWSDMPDARALSPANQVELITLRWAQLHEPLTDLYLQTSDYLFGPDPTRFKCLNGLQPCEILEENQALVDTTEESVNYISAVCGVFDQVLQRPSREHHRGYGRGGGVNKLDVSWGPIQQVREAKLTRFDWFSYFNELAGSLIHRHVPDCFFMKGIRAKRFFATHLAVPLQSQLPYNPHLYRIVAGPRILNPQFAYVPVPQLVEGARSYAAAWRELNGARLVNSAVSSVQLARMPLKPEVWMLSHLEPNASPEEIDRLARKWGALLGIRSLELNARKGETCTCLKCWAPKTENYNSIHYLNGVEAAYDKQFTTMKYMPKAPRNPFIEAQKKSDEPGFNEGRYLILEACANATAHEQEIPF